MIRPSPDSLAHAARITGWRPMLWRLFHRLRLLPIWLIEMSLTLRAGRTPLQAALSMSLARQAGLARLTGVRPVFRSRLYPSAPARLIGWGRRWSGQRAVALGRRTGRPVLLLEDGFLRSVTRDGASLSYVFDAEGIYYDAHQPSTLERAITCGLSAQQSLRAERLMAQWRDLRLSKYNALPDAKPPTGLPYVLVIDQTRGDAAIRYGMASQASFDSMLAAALRLYPAHQIVIKTHPDTAGRGKSGHFDLRRLSAHPRITLQTAPSHPVALLEQAQAVFTVTSQLGFEALIWGKRVHCFGMPFYAGWGLTEDALPAPARRRPVALAQLVHAALVTYPRYIDPVTQRETTPEAAFAHIGLQRRCRLAHAGQVNAFGFSRWKRGFIRDFLHGAQVRFLRHGADLPGIGSDEARRPAALIWGSAVPPKLPPGARLVRVEDGFLRSAGLGADLVRPLSLVFDDLGLHYDASAPSRLEQILATTELAAAARDRARSLRQRITQLDVTKYNLGQARWLPPEGRGPVILVVGQVESDASLRLGSPDLRSNLALLRRVRGENPGAYLVYKPHPDEVAGLRRASAGRFEIDRIADEILCDPMALGPLLAQVDVVHTMTSLLGFEALLRGTRVVCHGLPFYAGWGLTEDRLVCPRRGRWLDIDALVHGALIAYPLYFSAQSGCFLSPEQALSQLASQARDGPVTARLPRRLFRQGVRGWQMLQVAKG